LAPGNKAEAFMADLALDVGRYEHPKSSRLLAAGLGRQRTSARGQEHQSHLDEIQSNFISKS